MSDGAVPGETLDGVAGVLADPSMADVSLGRLQDAGWLFERSGLSGTVDTALPQDWVDQTRELGIDHSEYVWWYPEGSVFGQPQSRYEMALFAAAKGFVHVDEAVAMAERHLAEEAVPVDLTDMGPEPVTTVAILAQRGRETLLGELRALAGAMLGTTVHTDYGAPQADPMALNPLRWGSEVARALAVLIPFNYDAELYPDDPVGYAGRASADAVVRLAEAGVSLAMGSLREEGL